MKDYEQNYVLPEKEKEKRENQKIMKELESAEKARWDRAMMDEQHKKEIAKQVYDGNLDRLGMRKSMKDVNSEKDKIFLEQKLREAEAARQREMHEHEDIKK